MGTIEILDFKVILDAEGKPPSGEANSILNFYVKTMMNISAGELIRVRTKVDGVLTGTLPWEDSVAERDYMNEVFETQGSVQLDTVVGFSPLGGHTLEIIFETYTSRKTTFFTQGELNMRPIIIVGGVSLIALAGWAIYALTTRQS